jgi:predicted AlkP superfamily phosphohydrolase/phosphomutase
MSRRPEQTVVLGFDALSFRYLDEFDLPAFDALRQRGVTARLESTFPPWTGSAWPSMFTGVDPSHHGVYSFFDFDGKSPDEANLITRNDVDAPAIWNYLSSRGIPSATLNVPVTHPAEPVHGVLVPGYLAPEETVGYPEGIREELSEAIGEQYRIYATHETGEANGAMLESYLDLIDLRRRAATELLDQWDPAVSILQVQKTDTVFHQFSDIDAFRRVYQAADAFLASVLETVPEDTNVVVCSDHGIGPTRGYNVYVNEILRGVGLVEATQDGVTPTLSATKRALAGEEDHEGSTLGNRAVSSVEPS